MNHVSLLVWEYVSVLHEFDACAETCQVSADMLATERVECVSVSGSVKATSLSRHSQRLSGTDR